jgi:hypothetical protein
MKIPRFELTRVHEDRTQEPPQIVPVAQLPWDTRTGWRGLIVSLIANPLCRRGLCSIT